MTVEPSSIVLATDSHDPSGMGRHMLTLGEALAGRFSITIAARASACGDLLDRAARLGLLVKDLDEAADFDQWLQRANIDLLHVHAGIGWEGHELASAGHDAGIGVIRTEHLPYLLTDEEQQRHFHSAIRQIDHMIVVSQASRSSFLSVDIDPLKITAVQNGIPPLPLLHRERARAELGLSGKKVLLTVARFSAQKDHATLIRGLETVARVHPDTVLLLVGDGQELPSIQRLVADLQLSAFVSFCGYRDDVPSLMAAADLFVLPSLFEGLPLAVLEAMSVGLPVIATRIGGTIEALGETHPLFVATGDDSALASTIISMLDEPLRAVEIGADGKARFHKHFHVSRMAVETEAIYRALLHRSSAQSRSEVSLPG